MKPLQDFQTTSSIFSIVPENAKYPEVPIAPHKYPEGPIAPLKYSEGPIAPPKYPEGPIAPPKYPEGPIAPPRKPVWSGELVYKDPLKEQEEKSS